MPHVNSDIIAQSSQYSLKYVNFSHIATQNTTGLQRAHYHYRAMDAHHNGAAIEYIMLRTQLKEVLLSNGVNFPHFTICSLQLPTLCPVQRLQKYILVIRKNSKRDLGPPKQNIIVETACQRHFHNIRLPHKTYKLAKGSYRSLPVIHSLMNRAASEKTYST